MQKQQRALVLCSGGLDSTTLLARVIESYGSQNVVALAVQYGQKHVRELQSAQAVADYYGVPLKMIDVAAIFADSSCSLLSHSDSEIPHESYDEQLSCTQDALVVSTYVPFRNGLFLSCAASMALSLECSTLYYGAHHDDWAGDAYPDCSREFVEAMDSAIRLGSADQLHVEAPFVTWSKADIVAEGMRLGVPYELTWSCYEGGDEPCGKCATCIDRARAFEVNGLVDPLYMRKDAK